jgi:hypothetical protein
MAEVVYEQVSKGVKDVSRAEVPAETFEDDAKAEF